MKAARRSLVWSARQDLLECMPLELSRNPFMAARRKARQCGKNSGYRLPNQRRADWLDLHNVPAVVSWSFAGGLRK